MEGSWTNSYGDVRENTLGITCSNITFIGQGKDKTTVHGGIGVRNKKNVTNGYGLRVEGEEASVEMLGVYVKACEVAGLYVMNGASVKATQCEFSENGWSGVDMSGGSKGIFTDCSIHHNGESGVWANNEGTLVELRGEQTEIHHNQYGLSAFSNATINIYIPSRPITALVHDNGDNDLATNDGGKIQSQLSSSSLELTVIHPVAPVVDDEDEEDN